VEIITNGVVPRTSRTFRSADGYKVPILMHPGAYVIECRVAPGRMVVHIDEESRWSNADVANGKPYETADDQGTQVAFRTRVQVQRFVGVEFPMGTIIRQAVESGVLKLPNGLTPPAAAAATQPATAAAGVK
jgi:hypothetical protein